MSTEMYVPRRRSAAAIALTALLGFGGALRADEHAQSSGGSRELDLDTFQPIPRTGRGLITLDGPEVGEFGAWGMGLFFHHAVDPLVVEATDGSGQTDRPVEHRSVALLAGAVSLGPVELGASMPFIQQSGSEPRFSGIEPANGTAVGNLSLRAKANAIDIEPLALGLATEVAVPTSDRGVFAASDGPSFHAAALLGLTEGSIRIVANAGARFREEHALANVEQGNELTYGLGGAFDFTPELAVVGELSGALGLDAQASQGVSPLEVSAGLRYWPERRVGLVAGVGRGVLPGIGAPTFRGFALLTVAPAPKQPERPTPMTAPLPEPPPEPAAPEPSWDPEAPFVCTDDATPADGCPRGEEALVMVVSDRIETFETVSFRTRSSEILPGSYNLLAHVADALRNDTSIEELSIEAHVHPSGDEAADRALTRERAQAVRDWLSERGVDAERLTAKGRGGEWPLASGRGRRARRVNERVEFLIAGGDGD